ncbi:MAG: peptidyl-tRNA hydrolase Pth2 [Candidatus Nanoarchaeia archaeon]|nr:peptidyl-tRNA hydrolase Pth2 [Candidatus Nanoarchaeia archaeon]MDD5499694.1 peptidyl-tRNA hydrolase Pth2 [Candidatus Nanoarchaeia archaeon]
MEYKQAIVLRTDLGMDKGKLVSQGAHASVAAAYKTLQKNPDVFKKWAGSMKKIVLKVNGEKELMDLKAKAGKAKLVVELIRDAGRTQIMPGSITAIGIGPDLEDKIDGITRDLKLL